MIFLKNKIGIFHGSGGFDGLAEATEEKRKILLNCQPLQTSIFPLTEGFVLTVALNGCGRHTSPSRLKNCPPKKALERNHVNTPRLEQLQKTAPGPPCEEDLP